VFEDVRKGEIWLPIMTEKTDFGLQDVTKDSFLAAIATRKADFVLQDEGKDGMVASDIEIECIFCVRRCEKRRNVDFR
jgi:hypothetical protein